MLHPETTGPRRRPEAPGNTAAAFTGEHISGQLTLLIRNLLPAESNVRHQKKRWGRTARQRGHNLTSLLSGGGGNYFPLFKGPSPLQAWRGSRLPLRSGYKGPVLGHVHCAVCRGCHVSHCSRVSEAGFLPNRPCLLQQLWTSPRLSAALPLPLSSSNSCLSACAAAAAADILTLQLPAQAIKMRRGGLERGGGRGCISKETRACSGQKSVTERGYPPDRTVA